MPTQEEAIMLFVEASVQKVKSLTINSGISDDPDSVRTHWNRVIGWMTSEAFKLKHISEQVRNDFIRDAEARLQERLAREAEEKARREEEERAREEEIKRAREAEAKALADAAAAAEAEAKAVAEAEAKAAEAQHALTQGESSSFAPLVLRTLEELQKEQKEVRARLDQQDTVNANNQNLLNQLLQRMPPPPNPYALRILCLLPCLSLFLMFFLLSLSLMFYSESNQIQIIRRSEASEVEMHSRSSDSEAYSRSEYQKHLKKKYALEDLTLNNGISNSRSSQQYLKSPSEL
ncbi:hypothetical protein KIW84_034695 [Lathyrus oleraceus]|uniref:Uncharacterized protein n=1 Tax=Pisum sativum TaxID=3888 RepID=A0A9D4XZ41_PEA|nr:hypothetical protein KIW84_034695 [Pisum sativum]